MHLAVLANADHSPRTFRLTVGGDDWDVTGEGSAPWSIDANSISIHEEGPGGVSSMTWSMWDPDLSVSLTEGAGVEYWNVTADLPEFRGFVQSWTFTPQAVGRMVDVQCTGGEAMLDWRPVPALTIPALTFQGTAVQAVASAALGIGVSLNQAQSAVDFLGNQTTPIGIGRQLTNALAIPDGTSLREAIRMIADAEQNATTPTRMVATIDYWFGLRFWDTLSAPGYPGDYTPLTLSDVGGAGDVKATSIDHLTDAGGVPHGVYIVGGNAAGTGLVADGSGIVGPIAELEDSSILTAAARDAAGAAYLADKAVALRGDLSTADWAPILNYRAGGRVNLTFSQLGLSSVGYTVASIDRTFLKTGGGVRQVWRVAYGGFRPSYIRLMRRLTRAVRS